MFTYGLKTFRYLMHSTDSPGNLQSFSLIETSYRFASHHFPIKHLRSKFVKNIYQLEFSEQQDLFWPWTAKHCLRWKKIFSAKFCVSNPALSVFVSSLFIWTFGPSTDHSLTKSRKSENSAAVDKFLCYCTNTKHGPFRDLNYDSKLFFFSQFSL